MNYGDQTDAVCDAVQVGRGTWGPRVKKAIDEVLRELCSTYRFSTPLVTLVVTPFVGTYSISAGLGVTNAVMIRDVFYQPVGQLQAGAPLERTSPSRIDEIRARNVSNSYPMQFAISGVDTLELAPTPSDAGTLSVRIIAAGAALAADSDEPLTLPVEFHDLVWLGAAQKVALLRRPPLDPRVVQNLQQAYQARQRDLRSWLVDLGGEKPLRMQRRGDSIPNRDPSIYPVIQGY